MLATTRFTAIQLHLLPQPFLNKPSMPLREDQVAANLYKVVGVQYPNLGFQPISFSPTDIQPPLFPLEKKLFSSLPKSNVDVCRYGDSSLPKFDKITPDSLAAEFDAAIARFDTALLRISYSPITPTWEGLIEPYLEAVGEFNRVYGVLLFYYQQVQPRDYNELFQDAKNEFERVRLKFWSHPPVREALKNLSEDQTLPPPQRQFLENFSAYLRAEGIELEPQQQERFLEIRQELQELYAQFSQNVDQNKHIKFERTESDRQKRDASYTAARSGFAPENYEIIFKILQLRQELAALFGFENYFAYKESTHPFAQNAPALLEEYRQFCLPQVTEELDRLEAYGKENGLLAPHETIKPSDVGFLRERLVLPNTVLDKAFSFKSVRDGIFSHITQQFGLAFEADENIPAPSGMLACRVSQGDRSLGILYLDADPKKQAKTGNDLGERTHNGDKGVTVSVSLNFNSDANTHLKPANVRTFLHEMAHATRAFLSYAAHPEFLGAFDLPIDVREIDPAFFEVLMFDKKFLYQLSKKDEPEEEFMQSYTTPFPPEPFTWLFTASGFAIDILLHTRQFENVEDLKAQVLGVLQKYIPNADANGLNLTSLSKLFAQDQYAGSYYSYFMGRYLASLYGDRASEGYHDLLSGIFTSGPEGHMIGMFQPHKRDFVNGEFDPSKSRIVY